MQDYAYEYGIQEDRFPSVMMPAVKRNYTSGSKALLYDPSKCIRCQRCVKICAEVQMAEALTLKGRSGEVQVTTGFDVALNESTCEICGQCVSTCPVGAIYERPAVGQGKGKDLRRVRTTCPYCGVGCQLELNVHKTTGKLVRVTTQVGCVPNDGNTCVKGRFGMDFLGKAERLTKPLIRSNGSFREASWEEALALVAARFSELKEPARPGLAWRASARPRPPTRTTTSCRSWCGPASAPTTWTTAPACATPPPWPAWPGPSAAGP